MEPTITAKVISPCRVEGGVAEVGSTIEVDQSTFERLFKAGCLIEKKKQRAQSEQKDKEPETKDKEQEKKDKETEKKEFDSPKKAAIERAPRTR